MDFYQTSKYSGILNGQSSDQKDFLNYKTGYRVCGAHFPPPPCCSTWVRARENSHVQWTVPILLYLLFRPQNKNTNGSTFHKRSTAVTVSLLTKVAQVGKVHILSATHTGCKSHYSEKPYKIWFQHILLNQSCRLRVPHMQTESQSLDK